MHFKSAAAYDFAMETLLSDALALQFNNIFFKNSTGLGLLSWAFVVLIDLFIFGSAFLFPRIRISLR